MATTKIEWADTVWNPIRGCSHAGDGCQNCYAEKMTNRFRKPWRAEKIVAGGRWTGNVELMGERLKLPLRWQKPRRIFVDSVSDLFHDAVSESDIAKIFNVMRISTQHTYLILTKRYERMARILNSAPYWAALPAQYRNHIWLGASVWNQQSTDRAIFALKRISATVLFLSAEPLLNSIDIQKWYYPASLKLDINWIICGGETGPGARVMRPEWARSLRDQCRYAGLPFFFKKMGRGTPTPPDLDIREFPFGMKL